MEDLIQRLRHGDCYERIAAATKLGELGDPRAVDVLCACLDDDDTGMRHAATEALGRLGDARAVGPLCASLNDGHYRVRQTAAEALGRLGDARAVPSLCVCLNDFDEWTRRAAATALGVLGDARAVVPLCDRLRDYNSGVREAAARALGKLGDVGAVKPLCGQLNDNTYVLEAVLPALVQLRSRSALPELKARLRAERDPQRRNLLRDAVRRLEAATAGLRNMPLPAQKPRRDPGNLPRAASPSGLEGESLPVSPAEEVQLDFVPFAEGGIPTWLARLEQGLRRRSGPRP